jgi:hypothetical protein
MHDQEVATATLSANEYYRYDLTRVWDLDRPWALWIMLNPSTADATADDPTIRRCRSFAQRWGRGGIVVVNLFAYRATDPADLPSVWQVACGPENQPTIRRWLNDPRINLAVAAWGNNWQNGGVRPRLNVERIAADAGHPLMCLGRTKAGQPRHPLYVKGDTPLEPFRHRS